MVIRLKIQGSRRGMFQRHSSVTFTLNQTISRTPSLKADSVNLLFTPIKLHPVFCPLSLNRLSFNPDGQHMNLNLKRLVGAVARKIRQVHTLFVLNGKLGKGLCPMTANDYCL
ncbi:unnamed protein product [Arctogadus glacialis]